MQFSFLKMILIFIFALISTRDGSYVCAEEQSINEAVDVLIEEKNLYYLPQQTVFGGSFMDADAFKTSPPSLMIKPSTPLQMIRPTSVLSKGFATKEDLLQSDTSYCTSEGQSKDALELLPSKERFLESVMLSGYVETPSKTHDDYYSEMSSLVSISSEDQILIGSAL